MSKLHLLTRTAATFVRGLQLAVSALILAIFSYYLADLANRENSRVPRWEQAVEGMSGAAVIYTAFAVFLTFFIGGITFFAILAVVLDLCFCGCMIAIAVLTRGGADSCGSVNDSPLGPGRRNSCQLERVVFAVSIIGAILFLISIFLQIALARSHKREKRYGPSPANNYTSGSGSRKIWQRKPWQRKNKGTRDIELGTTAAGALPNDQYDIRASDVTGTTAPVTDNTYGGTNTKYGTNEPTLPAQHAGYTPHTTGVTGGGGGGGGGYVLQQTSGVPSSGGGKGVGKAGGIPEMETGAHGNRQQPQVQHDPNPYAEVHGSGYPHTSPESHMYSR